MSGSVSIIVPLRDEEERVEELVRTIAIQDVDGDVEVLVADGASRDRTVQRLQAAARRSGLPLTVVDNPQRLIPHGLNACLRRARGDFVVRMDARGAFGRDYVRRCVAAASETRAWSAGGVIAPVGRTRRERAVACAMDSPFGGIGWTRLAAGGTPAEADTVYCGTFRRTVFDAIGAFDESLPWNEDEDLNLRIRRAGGRVVVDPSIRVPYAARGSLRALFAQHYRIGRGKVDVMRKHRRLLSARSAAPATLLGSAAGLAAAAAGSRRARALLGCELAAYGGLAAVFSASSLARRGEEWTLAPRVACAFVAMHAGYGLGMLRGVLRWRGGADAA
jgi:succinoglycan biosynthesis protein ExoA